MKQHLLKYPQDTVYEHTVFTVNMGLRSCKAKLYSRKGGKEQQLNYRCMHKKHCVSVSIQSRHFPNEIINVLWGI